MRQIMKQKKKKIQKKNKTITIRVYSSVRDYDGHGRKIGWLPQ